jgi:hypothetical protein
MVKTSFLEHLSEEVNGLDIVINSMVRNARQELEN